MGAIIKIPVQFRKLTNDVAQLECFGSTISACLDEVIEKYPDLRSRLLESDGQVRRYLTMFVNGKDARTMSGTDTAVGDSDEISILVTIGGGQA